MSEAAESRELEARWRHTGRVEDEAAWLAARVKAKELDATRLEIAAALGQPAALLALGPGEAEQLGARERLRRLFFAPPAETSWRAGLEARVRVAVALARSALEVAPAEGPLREPVEGALAATERWILCRCARHAGGAANAASILAEVLVPAIETEGEAATQWASAAFLTVCSVMQPEAALAGDCLAASVAARVAGTGCPQEQAMAEVERALAGEMVAWALGRGDAVLDRRASDRR